MTEVNRNVGHDEISPETRLCYLQKGLLSTLIIWRSIQESTEGEKSDLRVCDRNAKKEMFTFTQHARVLHFQYHSLLVEPYSPKPNQTTRIMTTTTLSAIIQYLFWMLIVLSYL